MFVSGNRNNSLPFHQPKPWFLVVGPGQSACMASRLAGWPVTGLSNLIAFSNGLMVEDKHAGCGPTISGRLMMFACVHARLSDPLIKSCCVRDDCVSSANRVTKKQAAHHLISLVQLIMNRLIGRLLKLTRSSLRASVRFKSAIKVRMASSHLVHSHLMGRIKFEPLS